MTYAHTPESQSTSQSPEQADTSKKSGQSALKGKSYAQG